MRAIVSTVYGQAEVLRLAEIEPPVPRDGEVLVRVHAAGVDRGVWHVMTGRPYLIRAMGYGLRRPRVQVRGRELAGVVEAVGGSVLRLRPGDEVYGTTDTGSWAPLAVAREDLLAIRPTSASFEQSAAAPISGGTALQAVRDRAGVVAGMRVLVIGAAGGVGSFAVQIAKALGASVTAVCSPSTVDVVRALGADDVIDYTSAEIDRDGPIYDAVIDTGGNRPLRLLARAVTPRGTVVIVGGENGGGPLLGGFDRQLRAPLVSRRVRNLMAVERAAVFDDLRGMVESGAVTPLVDRTYPLAQARDAMRHLVHGHPAGKVVLTVSP